MPVVCLFAPADVGFFHQLQDQLAALRKRKYIEFWSVIQSRPGELEEGEHLFQIDRAELVLLLVSADFLADEAQQKYLEHALGRAESGACAVVPIIIRPALLEFSPIERLPCLPTDGPAVSEWPSRDAAWLAVTKALTDEVKARRSLGMKVAAGSEG